MKEFFEIVTLHDCIGCNESKSLRNKQMNKNFNQVQYSRLGDMWSGIFGIIQGIFSIFGRKSLTMTELDQIYPGTGPWATKLKQYLLNNIKWVDANLAANVKRYTEYFIHENLYAISGGKWANRSTALTSAEWAKVVSDFLEKIRHEGDISWSGYTEAGMGESLIPLLIIGGLVFSFMGKKTSRR